jgi:hypothetical protein
MIDDILNGRIIELKNVISKRLEEIAQKKIEQLKQSLAAEIFGDVLVEANVRKLGRQKIYNIRIRRGKILRRHKQSALKGWTLRGKNKKMTRMTMAERLRRRLSQRRGKIKRKAKKSIALRKRRIVMRKLRAMGVKKSRPVRRKR